MEPYAATSCRPFAPTGGWRTPCRTQIKFHSLPSASLAAKSNLRNKRSTRSCVADFTIKPILRAKADMAHGDPEFISPRRQYTNFHTRRIWRDGEDLDKSHSQHLDI